MRFTKINLLCCALAAGTGVAVLQAQPRLPQLPTETIAPGTNNATLAPKIQFAEAIHDFGKVKVNEPAKHGFIFTNTGLATLEITAVHPGCGCTTAGDWTHKVEPGQTGIIPIQFNAAGNAGPFAKTVTVTCNDPGQQTVILQFRGVLWKAVEVNPQYATFNVTAESVSNATSIVRIINNEEAPLTLSAPEYANPYFKAEVKATQPGKEFEVTIRPVPPLPSQNTGGTITLKTSSTNQPLIQINLGAIMMPTLAVNPPTIVLPPPPNTNNVRPVIFVRNNGQTPFKLTEPVVNTPGVDVQIKDIDPGRYASLTFTFPQDFAVPPGQQIHLSVKTGLASQPSVDVPVFQRPRAVN